MSPSKYVQDAAISPDGETLALLANFSSDSFVLFLTAPNDFKLNADPQRLGATGCKLAWRSDSRELAVVQADQACIQDTGPITVVPIGGGGRPRQLSPDGDDPSYQPVDLGG
jgi:hypothetical protein